uniref:RING-type domain-containing protein n=1 Tax=Glossina brevipalpis TaxID=37001 RepID=A0A1A9W0L2_9MUSC
MSHNNSWDSESQDNWDSTALQQFIDELRQDLNYLINSQQVLEEALSRLNVLSGDDRMIIMLPSEEYNIETSNGDQLSCAICIDDLLSKEIIRTLPCNHRFHVKCIDKWLQSHNTCPMCRAHVFQEITEIVWIVNKAEEHDDFRRKVIITDVNDFEFIKSAQSCISNQSYISYENWRASVVVAYCSSCYHVTQIVHFWEELDELSLNLVKRLLCIGLHNS